ncbi:putative E3 ubiquitin-protein ligase UBR7 [Etheostoma cragini]|uniref:putative E3 ubiquitin-protein ligase UBR7 n=1 Tax=Etheostoma cragini TaxID=417921 RepID=UPI00155E50FF|nr:putative E3 ubiquitin-protein ligase UBR7 [Etheostoma cragini]
MAEEQTMSLVDVLEENEELEEEASAVLAGSDSDLCSYPQGYVKRQALYACSTCTPASGGAAGVCLACSYKCHEGHELFELYTKRSEIPVSDWLCLQVEDEMIQCVVCEDWLHGRHLGVAVPDGVELQEMICESCMNNNSFLWTYAAHLSVPGAGVEVKAEPIVSVPKEEEKGGDVTEPSCKRSRGEAEPDCKGRGHEEAEPGCRLKELQAIGQNRVQSGAVFWPSAWRSKLCSCNTCKESLSAAGLSFLLDESDTVLAYENKGKSSEQQLQGPDPLMSALDNLNRVQQLEIIHGYNDMKTELKDFLQRFAAEGKVVTSEDIRQFFEQQQSRKRRRDDGRFYSP